MLCSVIPAGIILAAMPAIELWPPIPGRLPPGWKKPPKEEGALIFPIDDGAKPTEEDEFPPFEYLLPPPLPLTPRKLPIPLET